MIINHIVKTTSKAIRDFELIKEGDQIMIGLSGGKDSTLLLYVMKEVLRHSKIKFNLLAGHINLGFQQDTSYLQTVCQKLEIPFYAEMTEIGDVIFNIRQEKNPCALCAKMRRGALNDLAKSHNCNKVALAHHMDDVLETIMLKMFYEGTYGSFQPLSYLDRKNITIIRPFYYVEEKSILKLEKQLAIKAISQSCPIDGTTKRQFMKDVLAMIEKNSPYAKTRAFNAYLKTLL